MKENKDLSKTTHLPSKWRHQFQMFQTFHHIEECISNLHQCITLVIWCLKQINLHKHIHLLTCTTCPTCQTCITQTMGKNNVHQLMSMNFFNQSLKDLLQKDNRKILIYRKNLLKHQAIMTKTLLILLAKCLEMINNKMIIKKIDKEK